MSLAFLARANLAEMIVGINAGVVSIAPVDLDRVMSHLFDVQHLERRLEHLKWIRLGSRIVALLRRRPMRAGASRTGTFVAQITEGVPAMMAVLPVDLDAFGF